MSEQNGNVFKDLNDIANNVSRVYDAGRKAKENEFWALFQNNGDPKDYSYSFGAAWNEDTFKPKYSLIPTAATRMFSKFGMEIDLVAYLEDLGVILDFSKCLRFENMLCESNITRIGVVDLSSCRPGFEKQLFYGASKLKTIDKLILRPDGLQQFDGSFANCDELVDITIEGTIARSDNNLWLTQVPNLSKQSIESFVNALSDTTTGGQIVIHKNLKAKWFTDEEWKALEETKPNWKLTLYP